MHINFLVGFMDQPTIQQMKEWLLEMTMSLVTRITNESGMIFQIFIIWIFFSGWRGMDKTVIVQYLDTLLYRLTMMKVITVYGKLVEFSTF